MIETGSVSVWRRRCMSHSHDERLWNGRLIRSSSEEYVAVLIDVKTDLAESWQTICAAAAKMPY
jgi:hypothetical protein